MNSSHITSAVVGLLKFLGEHPKPLLHGLVCACAGTLVIAIVTDGLAARRRMNRGKRGMEGSANPR